jgi:hypothetical protein
MNSSLPASSTMASVTGGNGAGDHRQGVDGNRCRAKRRTGATAKMMYIVAQTYEGLI